MKTTNVELMRQARVALSGKWGLAIWGSVVYAVVGIAVQSIPRGGLLGSVIAGPLTLGTIIFSLAISRNQNPHVDQIFDGFKRFGTAVGAYFFVALFTMLWALLLVIPGLIAALSYSMTFYIMADDPTISIRDAVKKSKKMMDGNKWKMLCMDGRFLGWLLLCIPTLGIGLLWLMPYMQVATAKFYDDIKGGADVATATPVAVPAVVTPVV